jgi:hypothetical protein
MLDTPEGRAELERMFAPLTRKVTLGRVRLLRRLYRESGSALYVWEAWTVARAAKLETPAWVAEYLDGCAQRLLDLATRPSEKRVFRRICG